MKCFQSFQVGCKHLKIRIWNQNPQSSSECSKDLLRFMIFIRVCDFSSSYVISGKMQLLAFGCEKALPYSSLFLLLPLGLWAPSALGAALPPAQDWAHPSNSAQTLPRSLQWDRQAGSSFSPCFCQVEQRQQDDQPSLQSHGEPPLSGTAGAAVKPKASNQAGLASPLLAAQEPKIGWDTGKRSFSPATA